jgi:hypothetical protein
MFRLELEGNAPQTAAGLPPAAATPIAHAERTIRDRPQSKAGHARIRGPASMFPVAPSRSAPVRLPRRPHRPRDQSRVRSLDRHVSRLLRVAHLVPHHDGRRSRAVPDLEHRPEIPRLVRHVERWRNTTVGALSSRSSGREARVETRPPHGEVAYSTATTAGAPFSFTSTTTNRAGSVWLAFRPTTCKSSFPS